MSMYMGITPWKNAEGVYYCPVSHSESTDPLGYCSTVSDLPPISEHHIFEWLRVSLCTTCISACLSSPTSSWAVYLNTIRPFFFSLNFSPVDPPMNLPHLCCSLVLRRLSADDGLQTSASSPHRSIFTIRQEVSYSALQTSQGKIIFICNFLTIQVFCYFCFACLDRGKATYSMHCFFAFHLYLPPHGWHLSNLLLHLYII